MTPSSLVLQIPTSHSPVEIATARHAAMLLDIPVRNLSLGDLSVARGDLASGALPVGSVEYVRQAMDLAGIKAPEFSCYPAVLGRHMHRKIWRSSEVPGGMARVFVKPASLTKAFNGFVHIAGQDERDYDDHDREQLAALRRHSPVPELWASEPVTWLCEWRYYVMDDQIIGRARYDADGADDAPAPDLAVIQDCISLLSPSSAYALDAGVLDTGETACVETNDGWSVGLYGRALTPTKYLQFLSRRWADLFSST